MYEYGAYLLLFNNKSDLYMQLQCTRCEITHLMLINTETSKNLTCQSSLS